MNADAVAKLSHVGFERFYDQSLDARTVPNYQSDHVTTTPGCSTQVRWSMAGGQLAGRDARLGSVRVGSSAMRYSVCEVYVYLLWPYKLCRKEGVMRFASLQPQRRGDGKWSFK